MTTETESTERVKKFGTDTVYLRGDTNISREGIQRWHIMSQTSKEELAASALKPGEGESSQAATANVLRNKPLELSS